MAPVSRRVVMCRDVPCRETYVGLPAAERRQPFDACSGSRTSGPEPEGAERPGRRGYSAQSPRGLVAEHCFVQRTTMPG